MILRGLDIDDIIILALMGNGVSVTQCGKLLNLTQPAISQRISKIKDTVNVLFYVRHGNNLMLTKEGKELAFAAKSALSLLLGSIPNALTDRRSQVLIHHVFGVSSDRGADKNDNAKPVAGTDTSSIN